MNSIPAMNMFITPLSMWSRLAWKAGEMAISSAQVIGQRTSRFALAGATPNALDQREFVLMSQEKGEAALESAQAVGSRMFLMGQQFATLAFKQALSTSVSLMSIAMSRTANESADRQARLVRETMVGSVATAAKLSGASAGIAKSALKPVQKRVSKNIKRLRKR